MKKRQTFKCWNHKCGKTYTLYLDFDPNQKVTVACPYCGKEAVVDLATYTVKKVFKGPHPGEDAEFELRLPEIILTEETK